MDKDHELLELQPGASPEKVRQAYREMAKVWHPDRFSHDPRLQRRAEEKLKLINQAYRRLVSNQDGTGGPAPAASSPASSAASLWPSGAAASPPNDGWRMKRSTMQVFWSLLPVFGPFVFEYYLRRKTLVIESVHVKIATTACFVAYLVLLALLQYNRSTVPVLLYGAVVLWYLARKARADVKTARDVRIVMTQLNLLFTVLFLMGAVKVIALVFGAQ